MTDEISITADPAQQRELTRFIDALQSELGYSIEDAITWAAYYVARSARASTKSAPRMRRLLKNRGTKKRFSPTAFPHYVKIYASRGDWKPHFIKAGEEETDPARRIKLAGLAKDSWAWMLQDLQMRYPRTRNRRRGNVSRVTRQRGTDPMVVLENKLGYITDAIRHGGKRGIESAVERGMRGGFRYLEGRLGRALR